MGQQSGRTEHGTNSTPKVKLKIQGENNNYETEAKITRNNHYENK